MTKPKETQTIRITLPTKLVKELEPLLNEKDLTLSEVCRLYLRSLVTRSKVTKAMGLADTFQFGKYRDETMEVVLRAEPSYVTWLIANKTGFQVEPDVLALLEELSQ